MLNTRTGRAIEILSERPGAVELLVEIDGRREKAINYPDLTGQVSIGDQVLLNTTAVDLELGTGGVHFVICNLSNPVQPSECSAGHIMKLRYTPFQRAVLAVEEDESPDQERIREFESLGGMPVICCELHSQIAPAAAALKALTEYRARIAYVMTDGAALPIAFSCLVHELKGKGLLDATITCGQAFGGDIEAVNVYTGLIAAKQVARADVAVVCQGPGNAGAGSKYGFSGIQQGEAINAAGILGGTAIAVPRMSFADPRERHRGISHHTETILKKIALLPTIIALPNLAEDEALAVRGELDSVLRETPHQARTVDAELGLAELERREIRVKTMGRSIEEDREFFLAGSAGGVVAAEVLAARTGQRQEG